MAHFIGAQFLPPFVMTYLLPGLLLAGIVSRGGETRLLPFLVKTAIAGLFAGLCISFAANMTAWTGYAPHLRVIATSAAAIAALAWGLARSKGLLMRITVTAYDGAVLGILGIMLLILRGRFGELAVPYFNAASDQYYWLAYAEAALHETGFTLSKIFISQIHRPAFFLLLEPYIAFFPKELGVYQNFMIVWTYGMYALSGIAIAELAHAHLSRKMLGLMAMPMLFSLHWLDYYLISGNMAPQSMAIFLFIAGLAIWREKADLAFIWMFLAIFYATHLGTLVVFGLIIGLTTIVREGTLILSGKAGGRAPWHVFEKIFFVPAVAVIMLYALYASGALRQFDPSLISYDSQYAQNLTLFGQPYLGREQELILWGGIIGALVSLFSAKRLPLAAGFALPWIFLVTPLLAYHAFYASWQSFRYYLFLYPSAVILALLVLEWCAGLIARISSFRVSKGFVFVLVIGLLPIFAVAAANQQKFVFLDMIQGRDGGAHATAERAEMEELLSIGRSLPDGARSVMVSPKDVATTVAQWAFAPNETLMAAGECTEIDCPVYMTLLPRVSDIFAEKPAMIVIAKKGGKGTVSEKILEGFPARSESDSFFIYAKR